MITDFEKFGIDPRLIPKKLKDYAYHKDADLKDIVEPFIDYDYDSLDKERLLLKLKRTFLWNYCEFIDFENDEEVKGVISKIEIEYSIYISELDIVFTVFGQEFKVDPGNSISIYSDNEVMKRIYSDNDPYAEEEWEDEEPVSENVINGESYNLRKICDDYILLHQRFEQRFEHEDNRILTNHLNNLFKDKIIEFYWIYESLDGELYKKKSPIKMRIHKVTFNENYSTSCGWDFKVYFTCVTDDYSVVYLVNLDKPVIVKTKSFSSIDDPYAEEIWDID